MSLVMRTFIVTACLLLSVLGKPCWADDDDSSTATATPGIDGSLIQLDSKAQQLAGIQTQRLKASEQAAEIAVFGSVLNLEPLLQLRQQYLAAQAQQQAAQAQNHAAQLNLSRTQNLHQQDIVSTRRLQEQQALAQSDRAALASSQVQQQSLLAVSRLQWGKVLTDWFTQPNHSSAEDLLTQQAQIIQITLPGNHQLNPRIRTIAVDETGQRDQAISASLISVAPQVDTLTQSARYFFKTSGRTLPYGAHITAWLPDEQPAGSGVIIPETAVVRHLGQAFVFIKTADNQFNRRALPVLSKASHGYFVTRSFPAGEEIVTQGAQTLLSQQLKNLIPSEDND